MLSRLLLARSIRNHSASGVSYKQVVLNDTPAMYWPLNDLNSPAIDIVSGINATFPNGVLTNQSALLSALGPCFKFPGTSPNFLTYAAPATSSNISFECWFNYSNINNCALASINFPNGFCIDLRNSTSGMAVVFGGAGHATIPQAITPQGTTLHVVCTADSSGNKIYINSSLVASDPTTYPGSGSGVGIIGARNVGSFWLNGYISNVAIYNYALTQNQVSAHYFAGYGEQHYYLEVKKDAPLAYFRLADSQGTTALNFGTSTINGTYTGGYTLGQNSLCGDAGDHAVLFDGTSGYVTIGSVSDFNLNSNFTFEAIITTPTAAVTMAILSHGYLGAMLRLGASRLNLVKSYSIDRGSSNVVLQSNTRYIVGVTVTTSGVSTFYVNGVAAGNGVTAADYGSPTQTLKIGVDTSSLGVRTNYWNGVIDEVAVYPTALTAARMLAHAQAAGLA